MIDGGSARKYALYAIGEILLVVSGILIALQINNWNEWRKDRIKETNILVEISESLVDNITTLESAIQHSQQLNNSSEIVLRFLNDSLIYSDTLSIHFDRAKWPTSGLLDGLSDATFVNLSNIGFDILSNSELKRLIIRHFSKDLPLLTSSYNSKDEVYSNYDVYIRKNFKDLGGPNSLPLVPDMILNDNYYRSIILTIYDHRSGLINRTEKIRERSDNLLQLIMHELDKKKRQNWRSNE